MEDEIEEAQRQIRRSAAIIQDAFEGLTTLQRLHNRVSEASPTTRASTDISSIAHYPGRASTGDMQDRVGSLATRPNAMDPGHDVIVISAENSTLSTSTSTPTTQLQPGSSSSAAPPSSRGPRPSDPTLAALGSELRTMTQSFRERVSEFDELRRAIAQYSRERHNRATMTGRTRSRSPSPNAVPSQPPVSVLDIDGSPSSPNASPSAEGATSGTSASRRFDGRIRPSRGVVMPDRRGSLLRQRAGSESETSLGLLVAARTAASSSTTSGSVADTPTVTPASISATARSAVDRPRPVAFPVPDITSVVTEDRLSARNIPSNITSRITRLAQEIQQEGARITQQAESLRAWIYDRNARLDALRPLVSVSTTRTSAPQPARPVVSSDPHPTIISGEVYAPSSTTNTAPPPRLTVSGLLDPPLVPPPQPGSSELDSYPNLREQLNDAPLSRPRRTQEAAARARYLRQNVPTSWSATSLSASNPREERGAPWNSPARTRERSTDGPLSPPSRTIAPPGNLGVRRVSMQDAATSTSATGPVTEPGDAVNTVRAAIARARSQRRVMESSAEDEEDYADSRSYRIRRRYNADGDEEVVRVSLRPEASPGFGETSTRNGRPLPELFLFGDDSGEEDSWMEAITRLDSMSRRSAVRDARDEWQAAPRMTRGGTQMGTVVPSASAYSLYPTSLAGRRSGRGWPRLYVDEDGFSTESDYQYERDLAAMRTRAQALMSANVPPRTLGGATLPPPPPTTRPSGFVPTTQAPGSLWNDSSVRVRLRAATARVNEALNRQASNSMPPAERSGRDRNSRRDQGSENERPMWGSPTPFYPSALPLPLVEDVGSLQARSRVFASPKKIGRMPRRRAVAQVGR